MDSQELLSKFKRNPNGCWTPIQATTIQGVTMSPGLSLSEGLPFGGIDVARMLNEAARRKPELVRKS